MPDANVDLEKLEITLPVASELPYRRYDWGTETEYFEVLKCTPEAVDLSRLNAGASVLKNHNPDEIIGTVVKAWIEDARLYVRVKMRQADEKIRELFSDIAGGIVRNVSVGYTQDILQRDGDYGFVTRWTPLEVSMAVGVPADPSVGVYRSADDKKIMHRNTACENEKEVAKVDKIEEMAKEIEELKTKLAELEAAKAEEDEASASAEATADKPGTDPEDGKKEDDPAAGAGDDDPESAPEDGKKNDAPGTDPEDGKKEDDPADGAGDDDPEDKSNSENPDAEEIRSLGAIAGIAAGEIDSCIQRNMTVSEFRNHIKSLNFNTRKEQKMGKNYSFFRALQAAAGLNVDAAFERQISDELYSSIGRNNSNPNSIMVRANEFLGTGEGAAGAGMIGTEHRGDMFVELLRTKMGAKGFTALTGLRSNIEIPVQTAHVDAEVKGINDALTTQKPAVATLTLSPKKFGATVTVGKDLLAQANPDAAAFVMRDIEAQIARKLDAAILIGNTDPDITGVKNSTGVQTVAITNLENATWKDFTKFFGKIGSYDLSSTPAWVMTAADAQLFKSISKDAGSGRYILEDGKIDGFGVNIAGTITSGNIFLGNWADVLVGQWGGLEVIVDPYTKAASGMLVITATLLADVGVRNPEGFVIRTA